MAPELIIILCITGIICIALEVYLPGGVLGCLGAAALIWSIYSAYQHNQDFGTMLLIAGIAGSISLSWFSFHYFASTKEGQKALLMNTDIQVPEERFKNLINETGVSDCDLRPSGIAIINNDRYDVQTKGEYIVQGSKIIVSSIEGDHIYVKEILNKERES
jgi:membrane-bound serine protease (ClpP class)